MMHSAKIMLLAAGASAADISPQTITADVCAIFAVED